MSATAELTGCIERILTDLEAVARAPIRDERRRGFIAAMMRDVYRLGLAWSREPALRGEVFARLAPVRRHFADEGPFELQIFAARQSSARLEAEGWEGLCRGRSALAFFVELAGAELDGTRLEEDLAGLDEYLREVATREGYLREEERDADVPRAHWWWWAPLETGSAT
ncbi:hypothetical protein [Nannocystis punicea]|uniref:Uncharacterized protein n=1 Tax=Nannocystis punicea TaxID=2995304 RepID=A0ABY7H8G3_9BACT|nr:hypothetical protein [Nannocystis poenicansa]WAS95558.1 hypothetical protein O0S08_05300 [Nannocystis poenicansa]